MAGGNFRAVCRKVSIGRARLHPGSGAGRAQPLLRRPGGPPMRNRMRTRVALAASVIVAAGTAVTFAAAAQAAAGCSVTYAVTNQWPGGFGANVNVNNLGDPISSWTLTWSFTAGQTIT